MYGQIIPVDNGSREGKMYAYAFDNLCAGTLITRYIYLHAEILFWTKIYAIMLMLI